MKKVKIISLLEAMIVLKNKYILFGLFVVFVIAFWNLLEYLYSSVITHSGYQFSAGTDLFMPLVTAAVIGYLSFLKGKSESKNDTNKL